MSIFILKEFCKSIKLITREEITNKATHIRIYNVEFLMCS